MKVARCKVIATRPGARPDWSPPSRLRGVTLEYAGTTALRDMDWTVRSGESWAVIGANGAGKTSLMSMINGYAWPTSGEVEVLGNSFGEADLRDLRTRLGMVSAYLDGWIPEDEGVLDLVVSGKYGSTRIWKKPEAGRPGGPPLSSGLSGAATTQGRGSRSSPRARGRRS